MSRRPSSTRARRLSLSLPESLCTELDRAVKKRGFPNRSQAVAELLTRQLTALQGEDEKQVMAGTITLFYDASRRGLGSRLAAIQRRHLNEVISSLHILLEDHHTMEVLIVQGPAGTLRSISQEFLRCKGVKTGELNLTTSILPPVHARHPVKPAPKRSRGGKK